MSATVWAKPCIFFVGAHPDDSEGFSATAFLLRDKYDLHVIDLTALKPVAVFTHWPVDTHSDHVQTAAVVKHAIARAKVQTERYFFEVQTWQTCNYRPLYYVDVTPSLENKLTMLRMYACQNDDDCLGKDNRRRALMRGKECGFEYAETFTTYDGKPIAGGVLEALPHKTVL